MNKACQVCINPLPPRKRKYCSEPCRLQSKLETAQAWNKDNRDQHVQHQRNHRNRDLVAFKQKEKIYYNGTRDKQIETSKQWYRDNKERALTNDKVRSRQNPEYAKLKNKRFFENNPGKNAEYSANYRAKKKKATPPWLTKEHLKEISDIYKQAAYKTKETGIEYQVDHIHPIQGQNFSGLHVPWNLQVITKAENCAKSNKLV